MATVLQHPFGTTAFGDFLRAARERRGLTIQQISSETKIPQRLLESLEHGDLGAVPAGMYQRAEIRAYAKAVGLDQRLALSELERALGTYPAEGDRHAGSESVTESLRRRPFLVLALATAIAILGIVAWYGRMTPAPSVEPAEAIRPAPSVRPQPSLQPEPAPVAPEASAVSAGPDTLKPDETALQSPATTPPPSPGMITELVIVTDPPGARVIVDGIGRGTSPVTIQYLSAGEKRVRVLKDGFPAQERTVRLAPTRQATTVVIPLQVPAQ